MSLVLSGYGTTGQRRRRCNTVDHRTLVSHDHKSVPDRCSIAKVERRIRAVKVVGEEFGNDVCQQQETHAYPVVAVPEKTREPPRVHSRRNGGGRRVRRTRTNPRWVVPATTCFEQTLHVRAVSQVSPCLCAHCVLVTLMNV